MDIRVENLKRSIGKNKDKKLDGIQKFIRGKIMKEDYEIKKIDDLDDIAEQLDDDDFDEMFNIVTEKYNDNYPYYIYNYSFENKKTIEDLKQRILELHNNKKVQRCSEKMDVCEMSFNDNEDTFELEIKYIIYNLKPSMNGKIRKKPGRCARGKIIFLKDSTLALFEMGDLKYVKDLYKFFVHNYIDIIAIEPYVLTENSFNYDGPIENDRITIFLLELITNKLFEEGKSLINNYSKMGFAKPKNPDGLKNIKVGGNNLLNATEVAEQIRNGFNLKLVEFNMIWYLKEGSFLSVTLTIAMQDVLKITIVDSSNYAYNEEIVKYIFEKILELQKEGITFGTATNILLKYFPGIENRLRMQIKLDRDRCLEELKKYSEIRECIPLIEKIYSKI